MTYCFFSAQYLPTTGGVEMYTCHLANTLTAQGHRVVIVTSQLKGLPSFEVSAQGVELLRVPTWQLLHGRLPVVQPRAVQRTLSGRYADFAPLEAKTRVIVNTRFYPLSLSGTRFAARHHFPCIVIEHGSSHLSLGGRVTDWVIAFYEHLFLRLIQRFCTNYYAVSAQSAAWLRHFDIEARGLLYNAVDVACIDAIEAASLDLSTYGVPAQAPTVCYVGRLVPEKGVCLLLEAFASVLLQHPDAYLLLAGDGTLREPLMQQHAPHVVLLGSLAHDAVISLFKQAVVYCLPSISEGFPSTVLEAAAAGCYTIVSATSGGATELICDSAHGAVLPSTQPTDIAAALLYALQNRNACRKAANAARKRVEALYTWHSTGAALQTLDWDNF